MENLFVNLIKYRPITRRESKEDFFTEILAFVLNKDKELLFQFIDDLLLKNNVEEIRQLKKYLRSANYLKADTQVCYKDPDPPHKDKRPDIEIIIGNSIDMPVSIFIENKIGSQVDESQVRKYLEIQKGRKDISEGHVVLLTQHYEKIEDKEIKLLARIFWRDIYSLFKTPESKDNVVIFLIEQFIKLMESENMDVKPVSSEIIKGTEALHNLFAQIREALKTLKIKNEITSYPSAKSGFNHTGWKVRFGKKNGINEFYIYVFYHPLSIYSTFEDNENRFREEEQFVKIHPERRDWPNTRLLETFDIEKDGFLDSPVDEQIETMVKFLRRSKQKLEELQKLPE